MKKSFKKNKKNEPIKELMQLYEALFDFFNNSDRYYYFIDFINNQEISNNHEKFGHFLCLLLKISNNYKRNSELFSKITLILQTFKKNIKEEFSNFEIFKMFISNKMILHFLFEQHIIVFDESIINEMLNYQKEKIPRFCYFFYPEMKKFIGKDKSNEFEKEIKNIEGEINLDDFIEFNKKRLIGENDSYICSLIRSDSVDEFIAYVNRRNLSLSASIKPSIFETNSFLIDKKPTLIEYSTFFDSFQILQYLFKNYIKLTESLWLYAVHGHSPRIIHFLEENHISFPNNDLDKIIKEAIKCHHNNIANYFIDNFVNNQLDLKEKLISYSFKYYNYYFLPKKFKKSSIFFI